jgi:enterochelin esterase-like enzyme
VQGGQREQLDQEVEPVDDEKMKPSERKTPSELKQRATQRKFLAVLIRTQEEQGQELQNESVNLEL